VLQHTGTHAGEVLKTAGVAQSGGKSGARRQQIEGNLTIHGLGDMVKKAVLEGFMG
jgi:hypothetical protein